MSWNGKKGMKLSGGLGSSVFQPRHHLYPPDGTGRDVYCFTAVRMIDTKEDDLGKFNSSLNGKKTPNISQA